MGIMQGKTGIIYGVRNERSLCWGCAKSLYREGANLVLTFLGDREEKDVRKLAATLGPGSDDRGQRTAAGSSTDVSEADDRVDLSNPDTPLKPLVVACDLTNPEQVAQLHTVVAEKFKRLDFVIHGAAFANKEDLAGRFVDTSRDGYLKALEISSYTLTVAARAAEPLMIEGGSILTLTYLGSEKVVPNYNLMGVAKAALESSVRYLASDLGQQKIRVNAISAGPTMTLSARGVSGFTDMYRNVPAKAPLRRNTTIDEVGDTAAFLASDWSRGITGEIIYVDNGLHILAGGID